jgi:hypothetical protein
MVRTFEEGLYNAESFAAHEIENRIRFTVFDEVVHRLGARAGQGFPSVYRDHLANFMKINININVVAQGNGFMSVEYDLDGLGGYGELELGAHHQALEYEEPGSYGVTRTGKARYNPHPNKVQLPYAGQALMNEAERRQEFWEEAIVGQQGFITNFRRGSGYLEITNAPTFEEIAAARVFEAWIPSGTAPEWLWLENGFNESEPRIPPQDFSRTLRNISACVAEKIYEGALIGLIRVAERAGGAIAVGSTGRPFFKSSGRFVEYRGEIDESTTDTNECLGRL